MTFDEEEEGRHVDQEKAKQSKVQEKRKEQVEREEIIEREVRKQKEAYTK